MVIIGGTGMLAAASKALADRCRMLTSVARTERSLRELDESIENAECEHNLLALDWSEPRTFLNALTEHVKHLAPPTLVLAWLHKDELGPKVATALASKNTQCDFFQVRGSAAANPAQHVDSFSQDYDIPKTINYHQIILGFHRDDGGSRWLSNAEISTGVLFAIDNPKPITIVGSVAPWSSHP
ncbi:MAG: hypothetical protein ACRETC_03415 [Gammaproteobacteria bacterium]